MSVLNKRITYLLTYYVSCAISEILSVKEWSDLETWVGVVQGH